VGRGVLESRLPSGQSRGAAKAAFVPGETDESRSIRSRNEFAVGDRDSGPVARAGGRSARSPNSSSNTGSPTSRSWRTR
jgi:hypothetical protein